MSMSTERCDRSLLLQAEFDGELDAAEAAALAEHRGGCSDCRENWEALVATRAALREAATYHRASDALRRAVEARLGAAAPAPAPAPRRRRHWREAASFGLGAALAAMLVLVVRPVGGSDSDLVAAVVDDHVRSLQPGHLTDVVSTDQHTVKPWFDGRLDFAPPVKDLAAEGFPLVGGRLDYLGGRTVAALAYRHDKHPITLLVWPAGAGPAEPPSATRSGYSLIHWDAGGMSLWAVSDVERDQLEAFVHDWQAAP
jgi:anti-sigma factor RsiW